MNKWQSIYPVVVILALGLVFGIVAARNQHRGFISVASRSIAGDLITTTNSAHLVRINSALQAQLSALLGPRTYAAEVLLGDAPTPIGDGAAGSQWVLTNVAGKGLLIRLRPAEQSCMFHVPGFRSISLGLSERQSSDAATRRPDLHSTCLGNLSRTPREVFRVFRVFRG